MARAGLGQRRAREAGRGAGRVGEPLALQRRREAGRGAGAGDGSGSTRWVASRKRCGRQDRRRMNRRRGTCRRGNVCAHGRPRSRRIPGRGRGCGDACRRCSALVGCRRLSCAPANTRRRSFAPTGNQRGCASAGSFRGGGSEGLVRRCRSRLAARGLDTGGSGFERGCETPLGRRRLFAPGRSGSARGDAAPGGGRAGGAYATRWVATPWRSARQDRPLRGRRPCRGVRAVGGGKPKLKGAHRRSGTLRAVCREGVPVGPGGGLR